jgi:2-pyrone-4,6-dicarboxylate lactonase
MNQEIPFTCPPPVQNPRKPRFVMPVGATCSHCHVIGPETRFPHQSNHFRLPEAPKEMLDERLRLLGIHRAVIVQPPGYGTDNSITLDAIASSNGRFRGVALVDETFSDTKLQSLHEAGIRGIRFHFVPHLHDRPDLGVFQRLTDRVRELGWHVLILLDAVQFTELAPVFRKLRIPFVIDHMARISAADRLEHPHFRELLALQKLENCWVKISGADRISSAGPPFHDAVPFAKAILAAAPDRVLWGTDFPHPNVTRFMPDDGDLVDLIPLFAPDPETLHKVVVANPARLYGFGQ